jgi:dTDP-4-dehydrorhamnose 3,5-epimerase-like enzyme
MQITMVPLQDYSDDRGFLVALEDQKDVPFAIRRIYYIFGTKESVQRGFHAHKKLTQLVIAVRGECTFVLDDGKQRKEVLLNNPAQGLLVESMMWREMHNFSEDCVLMVLADSHYDESDYIRDYDQFLDNANAVRTT